MATVVFKFVGPPNYTPTLSVYRADTSGLLGSAQASEGVAGFYSASINVGSYSGNVLAALQNPTGALYGSTVDGQLSDEPPVAPTPSPTPEAIETGDPDVRAAAADPTSITIDGMTVQNRSVNETIAADRHLAANQATGKTVGMIFRRIIPGSSVGQ